MRQMHLPAALAISSALRVALTVKLIIEIYKRTGNTLDYLVVPLNELELFILNRGNVTVDVRERRLIGQSKHK
jgi:hypothetical protein